MHTQPQAHAASTQPADVYAAALAEGLAAPEPPPSPAPPNPATNPPPPDANQARADALTVARAVLALHDAGPAIARLCPPDLFCLAAGTASVLARFLEEPEQIGAQVPLQAEAGRTTDEANIARAHIWTNLAPRDAAAIQNPLLCAAPRLLLALQGLVGALDHDNPPGLGQWRDAARAAIAQAEGR